MTAWPEVIARIEEVRGWDVPDLARELRIPHVTVWRWAKGGVTPKKEFQERLLELAGLPAVSVETEWPPLRVKSLRRQLKMSQEELAALLGVTRAAVGSWELGRSHPLACARRFLSILEKDPRAGFNMITLARVDRGEWTANRILAIREQLGWSRLEMGELLGLSYRTIEDWETYGLPEHVEYRGCAKMLFSLLEEQPDELLELLEGD